MRKENKVFLRLVTRGEHGGGTSGDGVLPLLGEVGDPPDEDAVEGGGGHFPEPALHLSHCEVLQAHRPLQLPDLRHEHNMRRY